MNRTVKITASISKWSALTELPNTVDLVEVRSDIIGDTLAAKKHIRTRLVYVLKSIEEGGTFTGTSEERKSKLLKAVSTFDFIELEGERDLIPEILDHIPIEKRRIAWYGAYKNYKALKSQLEKYNQTKASLYKVVVQTKSLKETVAVINLTKAFKTRPVLAYAIGPFSKWSQAIAPFLGAPEVPSHTTDAQFYTPDQLAESYGLPFVYPIQKIFGIVGNPVANSISPKLHNEAYRKLNLPYLYLPFYADSFEDFKQHILQNTAFPIPIFGLTVVSPFKQAGYSFSNRRVTKEPLTTIACNGLVKTKNSWKSFSTDASGAIEALSSIQNWEEKNIAIVGTGGTGQTIASSLERLKISATLVNRTVENGKKIADSLGFPFIPLQKFNPSLFDVIIHTTPLGKQKEEVPFNLSQLTYVSLVIDHVYPKMDTSELVKHCELCNIKVIGGKAIARIQIKKQFEAMTGLEYPQKMTVNTLKKLKTY